MGRQCPECRKGRLEVVGMGDLEDTILVECPECGWDAELEPDGLGEGAMEMVEAYEVEMRRRKQEEDEEAKAQAEEKDPSDSEADNEPDPEDDSAPQQPDEERAPEISPNEPKKERSMLRFSDGVEIDTSGELRTLRKDGWYVVGEGMCIPVATEEEAHEMLAQLKRNQQKGADSQQDREGPQT